MRMLARLGTESRGVAKWVYLGVLDEGSTIMMPGEQGYV